MAATRLVDSNAFNFRSLLEGGVDPRTGFYTYANKFRRVSGNDQLGPELDLALRYSPLGFADSGYGKGWNLALTEFDHDPERRVITLGTGETFKVDGRVGTTHQLTMSEKKIDSFHLYEESASRWRVVHRSGVVEMLEPKGVGKQARAVPTRIFSRQGHWLDLEYKTHNDFPMLVKVTDMKGVVHLDVNRTGTSGPVELTLLTDSGLATYTLVLGEDKTVSRIELPKETPGSVRFIYGRERGIDCISEVHTPSGGFEKVYYQDGGHLFPIGSGLDPVPRVTRHVSYPDPGPEQDKTAIDKRYTYSSNGHNFLGGNATLDWKDDGLDNLFRKVIDYDYATTETLWVDGTPVESTVREFNKFHLLTREAMYKGGELNADKTVVIGDNIEQKTDTYNLKPGLFKDQPNYCQLVHGITTRWWLKSKPDAYRELPVSSTYDDHGNLLTHIGENGVEETYLWYGKEEPGYPGNAEGFVTDLKQKTEKPAPGHKDAPLGTTHFTYQKLPVLASAQAQAQLEHYLEVDIETFTRGDATKTTQHTFVQAESEAVVAGKPFEHGRLHVQRSSFPNPQAAEPGAPKTLDTAIVHTYSYETLDWNKAKRRGPLVSGTMQVLQDQQVVTGFDDASKEVRQQQSLVTGETVLSRDDTDTEIMTVWDALLRVERQIVSPGKPEEALRRYEYTLCAKAGERATQVRYDVKDVMTVATFDGAYRTILEERETRLVEEPGAPGEPKPRKDRETKPTYHANYDKWGRLLDETEIDWLAKGDLPLKSQYRYDTWGEQLCVIGPDGVGEFAQTDPVGDGKTGPLKREWRQQVLDDKGNELENGRKTGVTETQLNRFELPVYVRRWVKEKPVDEKETVLKSETLTDYDGFGRKVKEVSGLGSDEQKQKEEFTYDGFDRLLSHTLRAGEVVHRTYAAHSDKDLPVSIKVNDLLLGEQGFDGLDRKILSITGGRKQELEYAKGQMKPNKVITLKGEIEYEYRPHLTEEPILRTLGGVKAKYDFDEHNARLKSCGEEGGQAFSRTYYTTGEVHTEVRGEYEMAYGYSLSGRMETYKDVLGQTQFNHYDNAGRLELTTLGALTSQFKYDELGRTLSYDTVDKTAGDDKANSLKTTLAYDDLERERSRTFTFTQQPEQVLTQEYDEFDRIIERVLAEGGTALRKETYKYDTRGRLTTYECSGDQCPVDPYGKQITSQIFRFDVLDNITQVLNRFVGGQNMAVYYFENKADPAQLTRITNSFGAPYPAEIKLEYDDNGNLETDDAGRTLTYDALNRLIKVVDPEKGECVYGYDPQNILSSTDSAA